MLSGDFIPPVAADFGRKIWRPVRQPEDIVAGEFWRIEMLGELVKRLWEVNLVES